MDKISNEKPQQKQSPPLAAVSAAEKTPERKSSVADAAHISFAIYTVTPDDSLTQIAYYHHMRYSSLLTRSVTYLRRINGLTADVLLPGQKLKVLSRCDFTLNKYVDEDTSKSPPFMNKQVSEESSSPKSRNKEGEISNVDAIHSYLSGILPQFQREGRQVQANYRAGTRPGGLSRGKA